ncbi:MAG: hypothetical protein ACOX6E_08645 [Syntrophomonadaceae bacterium]|jgi:hypothetical protein
MVKFIHKDLGTVFFVDESRVDEYKAAGHKPAAKSRRKTTKSTAKKEEK